MEGPTGGDAGERLEPISATAPHSIHLPWMRQTWREVTFLHWRCRPSDIRPLVPAALQVDVCEDSAWVGLVPFVVLGLTAPHAPSIPWLSNFPETNVRTYVVDAKGRRGVWFFSLDAARVLAVMAARALYALPYFWAEMQVIREPRSVRYYSRRLAGPKAHSDIEIGIGDPIPAPSELEHFLTARFRLYAQRGRRLIKADVVHQPWPLHRAEVVRLDETLVRASRLPAPQGAPLAHFAPEVNVLVGGPGGV
jgi:uncharacterized protein YqjF (DUF2071 family)